ncbi:MAG: sugar phosphate isomerase/epimerase [Bacteroidota bacterium]
MVTRRKFVQTLTVGAAASVIANPLLAFGKEGHKKLKHIGYISGIIGRDLRTDWKAALSETVKYGYTEIEIGRFLGESEQTFLEYCSQIGIKPIAGQVKLSKDMDVVNKSLDALNAIDLKYAVLYWPWFVGGPFKLEDCKITAEILNQIGEVCKKRNLVLCWHNHDKEFIPMEEGLPYDYILTHTDKDLVKCEMDIYWVKKGGGDPVQLLKKYKNRVKIFHVKDMNEEKSFADVGKGIIDFPSIFSEAATQGIEHYFVERDNAVNGLESLKISAEYLKNLRFK